MRGPSKAAGIGGAVCSLLVLMYLAVVAAAQQQGSCPITDTKRYQDIIKNDKQNSRWFQAASTPPLTQAAFAFDVPRVKCLLAAKADVNQRVKLDDFPNSTSNLQWPLGAAVDHITGLHSSRPGVTDESVATVQVLLDAGANPSIPNPSINGPLYDLVNLVGSCMGCGQPRGCCPTPQNMVKIIKTLVAAGASVEALKDQGNSKNLLENTLFFFPDFAANRYCAAADPGYVDIVDFLMSKSSKFTQDPHEFRDCPKLFAKLKAKQSSG